MSWRSTRVGWDPRITAVSVSEPSSPSALLSLPDTPLSAPSTRPDRPGIQAGGADVDTLAPRREGREGRRYVVVHHL
jgi:hypothetical protein